MKLCDFCGFYIGPEDINCRNCSTPIPGRQVVEELTVDFTTIKKPTPEKIIYSKPKGKTYYFMRRVVVLLIIVGIVVAPPDSKFSKGGYDLLGRGQQTILQYS